jgi:hypothetical protein
MLHSVGSHWIHPDRTLYRQPTFSVELIYRLRPPDGFDWDASRARIAEILKRGVKVALRADDAHQQALPPQHHEARARDYAKWCQELAADEVFGQCEWLICGNEPNLANENVETDRQPMQAWWPARVVFGHGRPSSETDNVYQFVRTVNSRMQVLLPAVGPYSDVIRGLRDMPARFPPGSPPRTEWSGWESYQYELFLAAYDNNFHADLGEVKSAVHTYGYVGSQGDANGGKDEPHADVREPTYGAQFGTRWLGDALYLFRQAQRRVYGSTWDPWVLVSESNTFRDEVNPEDNYPAGWWIEVARYVDSLPNIMGLAAFVDQDYGGNWGRCCLTTGSERLKAWDRDHDRLLCDGW